MNSPICMLSRECIFLERTLQGKSASRQSSVSLLFPISRVDLVQRLRFSSCVHFLQNGCCDVVQGSKTSRQFLLLQLHASFFRFLLYAVLQIRRLPRAIIGVFISSVSRSGMGRQKILRFHSFFLRWSLSAMPDYLQGAYWRPINNKRFMLKLKAFIHKVTSIH